MESLQTWGWWGEIYIGCGFIGESLLGFIMIFWRGEGARRAGAGLRFVPPKAEAERQGLLLMRRSKKRASEQREDFFGHRKAVGADAAAGYLWSASVRSTDLGFSAEKNLNS